MRLVAQLAGAIVTVVIGVGVEASTCPIDLKCPEGATLATRDGRLACERAGVPDGPTVRCVGDLLVERQHYRAGVPDGLHEKFDGAGRLVSRVTYAGGEVHGTTESWFPGTEQLMNQTEYVRGQPHGRSRNWHRNGQLESEYHYEHGVVMGRSYSWHPNGKRAAITNRRGGNLHGEQHRFHINDTIMEISHYRDGVLHGEFRTFTANGQPRLRGRYDQAVKVGPWVDHDGRGTAEGTYVAGRRHGEWVFRDALGQIVARETFDHDVRNGPFERFEVGRTTATGAYRAGLSAGVWEEFDPSGRVLRRDTYDDGMRVEACQRGATGKLVCSRPVPFRLLTTECELAHAGEHDLRTAEQFRKAYTCPGKAPAIDWRKRRLWVSRTDAASYRLTFGGVERSRDGVVVVLLHHQVCSGPPPPTFEYRFEVLLRAGKEPVSSRVDVVPAPPCGPIP